MTLFKCYIKILQNYCKLRKCYQNMVQTQIPEIMSLKYDTASNATKNPT